MSIESRIKIVTLKLSRCYNYSSHLIKIKVDDSMA